MFQNTAFDFGDIDNGSGVTTPTPIDSSLFFYTDGTSGSTVFAYNQKTGSLYYDHNGSSELTAQLQQNAPFTAANLFYTS